MASKTHISSITIKNFAYCQNILLNKTANHQTATSIIAIVLSKIHKVNNLKTVIE